MGVFLELKDGDKTVYTHSSLVDEAKQEQICSIYHGVNSWKNFARFASFWGSMELVNRVSVLKKLPIYYRVGVVGASTLLGGFAGSFLYWGTGNWKQVQRLVDGAPVYLKKIDVPELDKAYFFLDDDNNFKPSLNHHAVQFIFSQSIF